MEKTNYSELWTLLLPYALNTINAGAISGAPSPHALDSAHHSGALGLTQLPGLTVAAGAGLIGGGAL
ncbi:MAG TPA: hypothetical protein PLC98_17055, partial [Anaerolineales bacterium]|nr:hypothetical protein [Anaerolineales bacterium]